MTLFIRMPRRTFEVSDLYIMALSFILFYAVTRTVTRVVEKRKQKNRHDAKVKNLKGGEINVADESELGLTILACIADDHNYIVKNQKITKLIFELVKEKMKNESLAITPNLMRYLATRLIREDRTLIVQVGNLVVQSESRNRFLTRISTAAIAGTITGLGVAFGYGVLLSLMVFLNTESCFMKWECDEYFEPVPMEMPMEFYEDVESGHLFVASEDQQVSIYTPSPKEVEIAVNPNGERVVKKTYNKFPKKAKQTKFSDFKKVDSELSKFNGQELQEPQIPQKSCGIQEAMDSSVE